MSLYCFNVFILDLHEVDIEFIEGHNVTISLVVSKNGHFLVASTFEGLQIWDSAALNFLTQFTPNQSGIKYTTCTFTDDSCYLAAGTTGGYLEIFKVSEFDLSRIVSVKPDGSSNPLTECLFINLTDILCIFGNTGHVYELSELMESSRNTKGECSHPGIANTCAILPHKQQALTLGSKSLCLWNLQTCELQGSAIKGKMGFLLRYSEDGKTLLTYGDQCYIEVWETESLKKTHDLIHRKQKNLPIGKEGPDDSSPTDICHCAVSNNGIVVGGTGEGDIYVWHGSNLEFVKELAHHKCLISFVEFSPDSSKFVSGDTDGKLTMWQLPTNLAQNFEINKIVLFPHEDSVEGICYSSQGRRLSSCSTDKNVHLYNGTSGELIVKLSNHTSSVSAVTFSSTECFLASGDERGEVIIWDGFNGQMLHTIKPTISGIVQDLAFVKQAKYITIRRLKCDYITLHEVKSGSEISQLSFPTDIYAMSASTYWEQDASIVCCLKDGQVKIIDIIEIDSMLDIAG